MNPTLPGLHHVTAITADAQANVDFYCDVLGLRLVKLTVNFDDPTSYHLYYGDGLGRPGTIMTFFAWPGANRGRVGPPQVTATSFAVEAGALPFWYARLAGRGITCEPSAKRFGSEVIAFRDPDGMGLEIVALPVQEEGVIALGGAIPPEQALRGFHGVTLCEQGYEETAKLLTDVLHFRAEGSEGNRFRFRASGDGFASVVDLVCTPDARQGTLGAGTVHHVAFRTPDEDQQRQWLSAVTGLGFNTSPVMDRQYFRSIYFREPGGVLFEIATNLPGFAADEPAETLGSALMLPPQYESMRAKLESVLPPLRLPEWSNH